MSHWPGRAFLLILLLLGGASSLVAQRSIPNGRVRAGTLAFDGRARSGDFVGTTSTVSGHLTGGAALGSVRGAVEAPVSSLKTGNNRRDRDMYKSLEATRFPVLRLALTGVRGPNSTGDSIPIVMYGTLDIHGVQRAVEMPGSVVFGKGTARVRSNFPLNLKDFAIGGLSKFFGVFKMYEDIVVRVDLTFALDSLDSR